MERFAFIFLILVQLTAGCTEPQGDPDDPLLAQVYDHKLYLSHARNYLSPGATGEDSLSQLRNYVQHWVREALLLHEAEKFVPEDIDVEALVEDYRASLIISNYEQTIVEMMVDTFISHEELVDYYEKNKEQYQLEQAIIRCQFIKLKNDLQGLDNFREWWDSDNPRDKQKLVDFSTKYADVFILEDSTWYRADEITALIPPGTLSPENMRGNTSLRFTDDDYEYFLRISESVLSTEIAPLSYIREQAIRYIMHKRRLELLEKIKAEVYEREMQSNEIRIFVE